MVPRSIAFRNPRRAMAGQSTVEFIIAAPVALFLILCIIQLVLLYRAKSTLDFATLEAARAGAVHGAKMGEIKQGLAEGMTPLFASKASMGGVGEAWLKAKTEVHNPYFTQVKIISPTAAMVNEHREKQYNGRYALPNDNLAFRGTRIGRSGVNVQDANILKIKVTYHYPLVVPFVGWVIKGSSELIKPSNPLDKIWLHPDPLGGHDRLAIESYAIVRMQSPIYTGTLR